MMTKDVSLSLGVSLECLDYGSGDVSTLLKNKARYHSDIGHWLSHSRKRNEKEAKDWE